MESEVSLYLFPTHSFPSSLKEYLKESGQGIMRAVVARIGKTVPKRMEKREKGESQAWPSTQSPQKLTDVRKEVPEPKGGMLFYQEA